MPSFAPSFTPRYGVRYRAGSLDHTVVVRGFRGESENATVIRGSGVLFDLYNALASVLADDFTWVSAFYIAQDTEVSGISSTPSPVTGLVALSGLSTQDRISSLGFSGKAANGGKASLKLFGFNFSTDVAAGNEQTDFVLLATEGSHIANAIDALNNGGLATRSNGVAVWYNRTTIKVNDHWLKLARRGIVA